MGYYGGLKENKIEFYTIRQPPQFPQMRKCKKKGISNK